MKILSQSLMNDSDSIPLLDGYLTSQAQLICDNSKTNGGTLKSFLDVISYIKWTVDTH